MPSELPLTTNSEYKAQKLASLLQVSKALYLDKRSIQEKMSQQRTNLAEVAHLNLDAITKIVDEFENPKIVSKKSTIDTEASEKRSYRSMEQA